MKFEFSKLRRKYLFAWDSALLTVAGGVSGIMLFVFHASMKRMLSTQDYTSVVALLALLNTMALPVAAIKFTMTRFVAEHVHENSISSWVTIYKRALKKITFVGLLGLTVWIACATLLKRFFAAPSIVAIIILGVIATIRLYRPIILGVLQGSRSFGYLAVTKIATPLFRVLLCLFAAWLGARAAGIMGAIAVSIVLGILVGLIPFQRIVSTVEAIPDYKTGHIYRYLVPVILTQGAFLLLLHSDLMFFKRFLFGIYKDQASAYAQAATLSRAVIFVSQPLAIAMFARAVNSSRKILFLGPFLFSAAISLGLALGISFFPEIPFQLMYGTQDPLCFDIARRYVWAALPLSLAGITLKYLWARHKTMRTLILIPVVIFYLILLFFFHNTPGQIIGCLAAGSWSALILLMGAVLWRDRSEHAQKRILLISLGGAGDTLMATPLMRELRAHEPDAEIDLLTMQGAVARDIVKKNAALTHHFHHNFITAGRLRSLAFCRKLRKREYDISLTVMPQNRLEYNLISFLIGAKRRLGFDFDINCGALGGLLLTERVKEDTGLHLVENNLRLLSEGLQEPFKCEDHKLDLELEDSHHEFANQFFKEHKLFNRRWIGFHPGSGTTKNLIKKRWPAEKWPELARLIASDPTSCILLFGSPDEAELRKKIISESGLSSKKIIDVGNHNILDIAAIIKRLDCFVCNDALLTHIAAALEVPTVVVTGPLVPHSTRPWGGAPYKVVRTGIECSPCYGYSKYGIRCSNAKPMECLTGITPQMVAEAVDELLQKTSAWKKDN